MNKAVVIGVLVLITLTFLFSFGMAENVITGLATAKENIENEYFKISDSGEQINEEENLNDTQNNSESR